MYDIPKIEKNIILVRHGQSKEQSGETTDGMNPELNDLGRKQMECVKARLSGHQFDFAYISPLLRAYQSYGIVQPDVVNAQFDTRVIENDEIINWYEPMVGYLPDNKLTCRHYDGWLIPCVKRALMVVDDLLAIEAEKILIFAHQGIFKFLIAAWLGIDGHKIFRNLILDNTSLTGLSVDEANNRRVQYVNDSRHLSDELRDNVYFRVE